LVIQVDNRLVVQEYPMRIATILAAGLALAGCAPPAAGAVWLVRAAAAGKPSSAADQQQIVDAGQCQGFRPGLLPLRMDWGHG
jgi:hypothetical protein